MLDGILLAIGIGFLPSPTFMSMPAIASKVFPMIMDYALGAVFTAGLLGYITYALIRPERF